ncbi:GNAT family N-acetyltransferase [Paenibacillus xerothermodurans]|uniref:GNAT family N-acetyltransferase n=1 Tax=Paenibacillus xerothermodurans TaxID=1977292 RepID=A0A2W1NEX2_PAEXE|nr:GNAT family N-acetyltransferase [Paenibacillus xerothermodurans]PZE21591.1 GNAT family N-acetyltransferase [Paenibacillus xerothermodurans]
MICRPADVSEIPIIAQFKYNMFVEVDMAHLLIDDFISEVIDTYRTLYSNGEALHYIVEANDRITACAGGFIKADIPYCFYKNRRYGFVGDVYVLQDFRRQGCARAATKAVLRWLAEQDIQTVRLLASHHARRLYESLGFQGTDEMVLHI